MDRDNLLPTSNIEGEGELERDERSNSSSLSRRTIQTRQTSHAHAFPEHPELKEYNDSTNMCCREYYGDSTNEMLNYASSSYGYEGYRMMPKFKGLSLKDQTLHPTERDSVAGLHRDVRCQQHKLNGELPQFGSYQPFIQTPNANRNFPETISTGIHGMNFLRSLSSNCIANYQSTSIGDKNGQTVFNGYSYEAPLLGRSKSYMTPHGIFKSVDDVKGVIYHLAKDKFYCHSLKRILKEGSTEDIDKIFAEIIGHIAELMVNPFGKIVVEGLLEVCNEEQRLRILYDITKVQGELIRVSCNGHGSHVVQKLIETLCTKEEVLIVASSLRPGIISLMKDTNGSHVVQCFLHCIPSQYCKFIVVAAILYCAELGSDSKGCCVLQKCLEKSEGGLKDKLIFAICFNSYFLSEDPYGNYVVQSMLKLGIPQATSAVIRQLEGGYWHLSMNVHGSNVVEECLKFASEECRAKIVYELVRTSFFLEIAKDKYGNYVVQTALKVCKGTLLCELVEAIRPHISTLYCNKYGKKVAECWSYLMEGSH